MAASVLINKSLNTKADNLTLEQALATFESTKSEDYKFLLGHKLKLALANLKDRRKAEFAKMTKQPKRYTKRPDGHFDETDTTRDLLTWIGKLSRSLGLV